MMTKLFGNAAHTAFVVPDLESTVQRLLASGIGPAFMLRRLLSDGIYRGNRNQMITNVAFITAGGVQYEFLEQVDDTPSIYGEFLENCPAGGLHHVAYYSADFDADMARAKQAGFELQIVQEFLTPEGQTFEYYMEPVNSANPLLIQFMYPGPTQTIFHQIEEISAHWDGSEPVRNMFDLLPPEIVLPVAP
jgi:catechol 2,3-dioxygenase-like lactoylglutathione lyase family enzyme